MTKAVKFWNQKREEIATKLAVNSSTLKTVVGQQKGGGATRG